MRFKMAHGFMVIVLLLMQLQSLVGLRSVAAAENVPNTVAAQIIQNEELDVKVEGTLTGEQIHWQVAYNKKASETESALKILTASAAEVLTPEASDPEKFQAVQAASKEQQGWWIEKKFSHQSQEVLNYTTPKSQNSLIVTVGIDAHNQGQTTTKIFGDQKTNTAYHVVTLETTPAEAPQENGNVEGNEAAETETGEDADADPDEDTDTQSVIQTGRTIQSFVHIPVVHGPTGSPIADDPFLYPPHSDGHYPGHNTNEYGAGGSSTSDNIRNYNYGVPTGEKYSETTSIETGNSAFEDGYHTYKDDKGKLVGYTKKTVAPIDGDPNSFQVQLDMIAAAVQDVPKLDIVLVLDRSSSMQDNKVTISGNKKITRWEALKLAVDNFSNSMLTGNTNVQMGLVGFSSDSATVKDDFSEPHASIGWFGNAPTTDGNEKFSGYTTSAADIQKHQLLAQGLKKSGTPTFVGYDAGLRLLTDKDMDARDGVNKIMVVITDGEPSFGPKQAYYKTGANNNTDYSTSLSSYTDKSNDTTYNAKRYKVKQDEDPKDPNKGKLYYSGTGSSTDGPTAATNTFLKVRNTQVSNDIKRYAIGFASGTNAVLTNLAGGDSKNVFYANDIKALINSLQAIAGKYTMTIADAEVVDPMSKFVTLDEDSFQEFALDLSGSKLNVTPIKGDEETNQGSIKTDVNAQTGKITLSSIGLGGTKTSHEGYRITYKVTLNKEYRNGQFYPTNGSTYLENGVNDNEYLHFAVPSVRTESEKINIQVAKEWQDNKDHWGLRQDLVMTLQSRPVGSTNEGEWKKVEAKDYVKGLSFEVPTTVNGKKQEYRVRETTKDGESQVWGYKEPKYNPESTTTDKSVLTVVNVLKETDYQFTKYAAEKGADEQKKPFSGVEFTATHMNGKSKKVFSDSNGIVKFEGLAAGEYTITETPQRGFETADPFTLTVSDPGGGKDLTTDPKSNDKQVVNYLKPFTLDFLKLDKLTGIALKGAQFKLTLPDKTTVPRTTDGDGKINFGNNLKSGDYVLEEVAAPDGYLTLKGKFTFTISNKGIVSDLRYDGTDLKAEDGDYKLVSTLAEKDDQYNKISITVKNIPDDKEVLPQTGGPGNWMYLLLASVLMSTALGYALWINNRTKEV